MRQMARVGITQWNERLEKFRGTDGEKTENLNLSDELEDLGETITMFQPFPCLCQITGQKQL